MQARKLLGRGRPVSPCPIRASRFDREAAMQNGFHPKECTEIESTGTGQTARYRREQEGNLGTLPIDRGPLRENRTDDLYHTADQSEPNQPSEASEGSHGNHRGKSQCQISRHNNTVSQLAPLPIFTLASKPLARSTQNQRGKTETEQKNDGGHLRAYGLRPCLR
jgi:hypothetical protein